MEHVYTIGNGDIGSTYIRLSGCLTCGAHKKRAIVVIWASVQMVTLIRTADTMIDNWSPATPPVEVIIPELTVPERITIVAANYDYQDANELISLAACESGLDPEIISPNGKWRGLFQADTDFIPYGTCAFDVECATSNTIEAIYRGETWRWPTCWPAVHNSGLTSQ